MTDERPRTRRGTRASTATGTRARKTVQPPDGQSASREQESLGSVPISELFRGRIRLQLIRDLAMGEWNPPSIAKRLGVETDDILFFQEKFSVEISEVRAALAGQLAIETAGLWISRKQNRIAQLQADYDELEGVLQEMREHRYQPTDNDGSNLGSRRHRAIVKSRIDLLRATADELSPRNSNITGAPDDPNIVHYVIDAGPLKEALT